MKRFLLLFLAVLLCLPLTACAPVEWVMDFLKSKEKKPSSSSSVAAGLEEEREDRNFPLKIGEVTIEKKPERVAVLNPSITEVIFDMGLEIQLEAVGEFCSYPEKTGSLPRCGSELLPDVGAITSLNCDLVLSLNRLPDSVVAELKKSNIPVVTLDKPGKIDSLPDYYLSIATALLGKEDGKAAAEEFYTPLMSAYGEIGRLTSGGNPPTAIFMAMLPLTLATGDTMQGEILAGCGTLNAALESTDWQYPENLLVSLNPDVIVADTRTVTAEEIKAHKNYKTTPAVKNGNILELDGSGIENCGARLFQSALAIAKAAHPGLNLPGTISEFSEGLGVVGEGETDSGGEAIESSSSAEK